MTAKSKKKKSTGRKIGKLIRNLVLFGLLGLIGFIAYLWFAPMTEKELWAFVPEDAVFVVEADDPIENWKSFSGTDIWKHLKKNDLFSDIEESCNYLDTLIAENEQLFDVVSGKKLLVVAQMTRSNDYDFTYLMDLKKGARVSLFMDVFKPIITAAGFPMTSGELNDEKIYTINDGADDLFLGFKDNVLIASYSKTLYLNVLKQYSKPFYSREGTFLSGRKMAYDQSSWSSLGKFHMNFDQLDEYMAVFMDEVTPTLSDISDILSYASFDLKMEDEYAEMSGVISVDTSQKSLATVMTDQNRGEILAPKVLPPNTSYVLTIDYHDFDYFYESIAQLLGETEDFKEFEKSKKSMGSLLGLTKKEKKRERKRKKGKDPDYFDWLGQEIALALLPVNESKTKQAYLALFHTADFENAVHDLEVISRQIRRRTPVRFKDYDYNGVSVRYLAMKGFFRLFMGKLFKKFDQPKYVVLEDFVVFSNDTTAIHRVIDAQANKESLYGEPNFRKAMKHFEDRSNYFLYVNSQELYPFLPSLGDPEASRGIRNNRQFITCFPYAGIQLIADEGKFEAEVYLQFEKP